MPRSFDRITKRIQIYYNQVNAGAKVIGRRAKLRVSYFIMWQLEKNATN